MSYSDVSSRGIRLRLIHSFTCSSWITMAMDGMDGWMGVEMDNASGAHARTCKSDGVNS